jgi:uncharacterized membrane protein
MRGVITLLILAALPLLVGCDKLAGTDKDTVHVEPEAVDVKNDVKGDASLVKVEAKTVPGTVDVKPGALGITSNGNVTVYPNAITVTNRTPLVTTSPETVKLVVNSDALHFEAKPGSFVFTVEKGAIVVTVDASVFGKNQAAEQASKAAAAVDSAWQKNARVIYWIFGIVVALAIALVIYIHVVKERSRRRSEERADRAEKMVADLHRHILSKGEK